jgi:hypothetical protein
MFPDPYGQPTFRDQASICVAIATLSRLDLLPPPSSILLRPCPVIGATVPEAAVHEYSHARCPEDQICATPQPVDWRLVEAEAKAASMQSRSERNLRSSMTLAGRLHSPSGCGRRCRRNIGPAPDIT